MLSVVQPEGVRSPLSFFENEKTLYFCKDSALVLGKNCLFVCIYGLNSHLKCSLKRILNKKYHYYPVGSFYCNMKLLSNWETSPSRKNSWLRACLHKALITFTVSGPLITFAAFVKFLQTNFKIFQVFFQ